MKKLMLFTLVVLGFVSPPLYAGGNINIKQQGLSDTYPGYTTIVYNSFADTMKDYQGRISSFSVIDSSGHDQTFFALMGIHNGNFGVVFLTPESCTEKEKNIPFEESPAIFILGYEKPYAVAKICNGENYYLYPIDEFMHVIVKQFLTEDFVRFDYDFPLLFETNGFKEAAKINFNAKPNPAAFSNE